MPWRAAVGRWRCGIGDSQRGLLWGRGTSFLSFKSLSCYSLNLEFVFDKPQSVIRTGILHIALVVGGDALHHLSVAVITGDLYGHAAELVLDVHVGE